MKQLTLVRHGKSSWKYEGLEDFERPLNLRGWNDVPVMALHYVAQGNRPDYLMSSFATRALTTARIFAKQLCYPIERIRLSESIYECGMNDLYEVFRQLNDQHMHACVFGHNPSFTAFVNDVCNVDVENVPTSGIANISLNISSWKEMAPGCGQLLSLDSPKTLTR